MLRPARMRFCDEVLMTTASWYDRMQHLRKSATVRRMMASGRFRRYANEDAEQKHSDSAWGGAGCQITFHGRKRLTARCV